MPKDHPITQVKIASTIDNYYFSFEPPVPLETLADKESKINPLHGVKTSDCTLAGWPLGYMVMNTATEQMFGVPHETFETDEAAIKHAQKIATTLKGILVIDKVEEMESPYRPAPRKAQGSNIDKVKF